MAGEEIAIAYAAGCLTPFILQYFALPYLKRYWGIKDKPKKAQKGDDPPKVASKGKTYEIHVDVHLPKDEDEKQS